ncbi:MAG: TRAP transporter substrate-binding protein [Betaproteobacteria bacterium]|nr:TRAP transporter substrate-binding protein [Betaproteobacteria bacterium]
MASKLKSITMGLLVSAGLVASAGAWAQPVELAFSGWVPPTHVLMRDIFIPWGKDIETQTEGRVKVNFLPKPVTNPVGHLDAVRNGVADLTFVSLSYYPGRFDLMKFGILPFSGRSAESTSVASWRIFDKYLRGAEEFKGVRLLSLYGHGPGGVFTTKKKVEKIEDFEDLKIRIGGGIAADVGKILKVNAVVKPAPESYELLSTGVVDGVFFPMESLESFRLNELVKFATVFPGGLYADLHGVIMNEKAFAKLSEKDQAILLKLSGETLAKRAGAGWGAADTSALNSLKSKSVQITEANEALIKAVKARTAEFEQTWLAVAKAKGIDGPKVLKDFRSELAALEAGK